MFFCEPEPDGYICKGGREGAQKTDRNPAGTSCPDGTFEQAARIFAAVPALRAMSCQMNELNGLLLQAEYDNVELYGSAIRKMQQEIEVLNSRAITAAAAVRSSKASTIFTGETTAELVASAKGWSHEGSPTRQLPGVDASN